MRNTGAVFSLVTLAFCVALRGQQEEFVQLGNDFVITRNSSWAVNPFKDSFVSSFSVDTVTSSRGILKSRYEDSEEWSEMTEDWRLITFYESVNGHLFKVPFSAPVDWYFRERIARNQVSNLYRLTGGITKQRPYGAGGGAFELVGVETGVGRASLNISGNINVSGKMVFQDQELARANFRESQTTHFEFDQRQNLLLEGKIGERVSVLMDIDSERDVDWENKIRINYSGREDEIVQKVEAGNISLSLPSTQFVTFSGSNSGLFGLKSLMKLGPMDVTAIASIERTRKEKQKFTEGAETQGQTIPDYQYRKNQYFFIDEVFRNGGLVLDNDGGYMFDDKGNFLGVPSFYPLQDGKHRIGNVVVTEIEVFKSVGALARAGTYYGLAYVDPYFNSADSTWRERDLESEPEGSFFQRLERNQDYTVSEDLGYIRLTTPIYTEILAVSYTLSERGKAEVSRFVGELSAQVLEGDTIHVKLIKPLTPNPNHPTWPLAFKNVYSLGASNINPEGFELAVLYKNGTLGNDERDSEGTTYIHLFGLDSLDEDARPVPDDFVDKANPNVVNLATGELFFPMLHPFETDSLAGTPGYRGEGNQSPTLSLILPESAPMYRSLDDRKIREKSKFDIKVSYQNKSATMNLGGFMLVEGSEEVYLNDVRLQRDRDYTIDYFTGTLTILTDAINKPGADLEILYDKHELVSFDKKTIVGTRAQMGLGPRSFIGATALYYNQSVINEKIEVGYEPMRNLIWDVNGRYEADLDVVTQALDKLPLVETNKPSSFRLEGEFARVLPNPNPSPSTIKGDPRGVAFIDDFEGSKRTTSPSIRQRFWHFSSSPRGYDPRNRARLFWYNPYTQVLTQDIWPNQEVSTRAQNHLTDILVLNFSRREAQKDSVDPDATWAGITASLYSSDFNQSQSKFFEIWLLTDENIQGKMTVDLGFITEDQNANGVFDTEDKPESGLLTGNTFLEDEEDIGLDGCEDLKEDGYGGCLDTTYSYAIVNPAYQDLVYTGADLDILDPNGDNWSFDEQIREGPEKYRYINGYEGNGTAERPLEGARYPDTEDINRDGNFDKEDDYLTVTFDLSPHSEDWQRYQGGMNTTRMGLWRLYRVPLSHFAKIKKDGNVTWDAIKFIRLVLNGIADEAEVKIAKVELVGNEWQELGVRSDPARGYTRNDSVFAVTVVNTEDNQNYAQSVEEIGVQGEYDRIYGIRKKEQSLVLTFSDLKPAEEGAAQKNLIELKGQQALSYLTYEEMRLFTYGKNIEGGPKHFWEDSTDVEFFMRLGRDDDFYEVRQPLYEGWDKFAIDLDFVTSLKSWDSTNVQKLNAKDAFIVSDSSRKYISTANDGKDTLRTYTIHGSPALSRIQYFVLGVRNKNTTEPVSGEVWLDELRLTNVRHDAGTAVRLQSAIALADLGTATVSYNRQDADFHVLQQRLGSGKSSERLRVDTRMNLNKLFPQSWGLSLPLSMSYANNLTTPKYLPGSDVLLKQKAPPDSVLTRGQKITMSTSFSKSTRSDRWYSRYTLDRLKANISGSQGWNSDEQIARRFQANYAGGLAYSLAFGRDNYLTPLEFLKGLPWLGKRLAETHLYYTPSSIDMSANVSETLSEIDPRVGEFKSQYNLGLNRSLKLGYKVLENLTTSYSKAVKSDMDSFRGRYSEAVKTMDPGIVTDVVDNLSTSFSPSIFSWFDPSFTYASNYRWSKPIESTQEGANITSQIRFSSSVTVSPKTIIETIYKPARKPGGGAAGRRGRRSAPTPATEEPEEEKKEPQDRGKQNVLKLIHDLAGRVSPLSITYSENRSQNQFGVIGSASIPYRFGFTDELGLEHSEEVGVNRSSVQRQQAISLRSGLTLTRRINTSLSFSNNHTLGLDGNNVRTESQTRDFFPLGVRGDKGLPFTAWSVRWSGVEKWPFIRKVARSASLEHAFAGKETRTWKNEDLQSSKYTASFSPLGGISMTLLRGVTLSARFATVRTVDNRFGGINSTRVKTDRTLTASSNYSHRGGLRIPVFFFRDFNLDNTINFTLTFDFSQSVTQQRNNVESPLSTADERKSWKLSPRVSYSFSKTVTGGVWFEYRETDSRRVGRNVDRDFGFDVNIAIRG